MKEQFMDFVIEVLFILIWGILLINAVYFTKRLLKKRRSRRFLILLVLLAGCLGSQQGTDVHPVQSSEPSAIPESRVPIFEASDAGLEAALASGYPVVLNFNASWCNNCREQGAIMEELEGEYPGVVFLSIDSDEYPELAEEYRVEYLPTIVIFDSKGERVETLIGFTGKETIEAVIKSL